MKRLLAILALGLMLGGCGGSVDDDESSSLLDGILADPDATEDGATEDSSTGDYEEPYSEGPDAPPNAGN